MSISRVTATAFAQAVHQIRPTWDVPGIRAAIERASTAMRHASDSELLRAAVNLAENGQVNTPGLLTEHGPWWDTAGTNNARPSWVAARVCCPEHPQHPAHACPICEANRGAEVDPANPPEAWQQVRQQLAAKDWRRTARPVELTTDVTTARALIDQEQP